MNGTMFTEKHVALKYRNSTTLLNLVKKKLCHKSAKQREMQIKKKKKNSGYQR